MSGEKKSPEEGSRAPGDCPEVASQGAARSGGECWGWIAISVLLVVLAFVASRYAFKAGMSYAGYCFAEDKTLSDNEKMRAVVKHVLKKYPPAVIRTPVDSLAWSVSSPEEPIHYKDVDDFLTLNPGCCELTEMRSPEEGSGFNFMERLTGTVSGYARIDYRVLYREDGVVKSILSKNHLAISNCGKPARKWQPGDYFFGFHPSNLSY